MPPPPEIQARLDWATRTAEQAGELLLASFRTDVATERKDRGIVTELDRRAEGLIAEYQAAFRQVFGTALNPDGVAKAIAAYERTILSGNSPYDRFRAGAVEGRRKPA